MLDTYDEIALPVFEPTTTNVQLMNWIEDWTGSRALVDLVAEFGDLNFAPLTLAQRLQALEEFSIRWDYRGGQERNLATQSHFSDDLARGIQSAARALGLIDEGKAHHAAYDHLIILGGLARACIVRPRFAKLVVDGLEVGEITAIGAFRPLGGDEPGIVQASGLDEFDDEFSILDAGLRRAFRIDEPGVDEKFESDVPNQSWLSREYIHENGRRYRVIAAPSTDPSRRANTPDSYKFFAESMASLQRGARVLLVTSSIYQVFQGSDAIRLLGIPFGVHIETIGAGPKFATEPVLQQTFTPSNYLQEIRSTIRSLRVLFDALQLQEL